MMKRCSATASSIAIRSKVDWPPEVASMLDVLRIVAPRVGDAGGCLVAVVAYSGHAVELALLDIFSPAARMAVG